MSAPANPFAGFSPEDRASIKNQLTLLQSQGNLNDAQKSGVGHTLAQLVASEGPLSGSTATLRKTVGAPEPPPEPGFFGQAGQSLKEYGKGIASDVPVAAGLAVVSPVAATMKMGYDALKGGYHEGTTGATSDLPTATDPRAQLGQGIQKALGFTPVIGPLAGQLGRDIGERNYGGAAVTAANLAATVAPLPRAITSIGSAAKAGVASNLASRARSASDAGYKGLSKAIKAESVDQLPARYWDRIAEAAGGKDALVGKSPAGQADRLLTAVASDHKMANEYVQSILDKNPEAPIPIGPIRKDVAVFQTEGLARHQPELAAALDQSLSTGTIPAKQAYRLKAEMNKYHKADINRVTAIKPQDAMEVGNHLRKELGDKFGAEFTLADEELGHSIQGEELVQDAANKASMETIPGVASRIGKEVKNLAPAIGAGAGGAVGGPGGALLGGAAGRVAQEMTPASSALPVDVALHGFLKKIQFRPGNRPVMPQSLSADVRPAAPGSTVVGQAPEVWDELTQMQTGAPPPTAPWDTGSGPTSPMVGRRVSPSLQPPVQPGNITQVMRPTPAPERTTRLREQMTDLLQNPNRNLSAIPAEPPPYPPEAPPPATAGARGLPPAEGIGGMQLSQPAPVPPMATGAEQSAANLQQLNRGIQQAQLQQMQAGNQAALNLPPPINEGFIGAFEKLSYKELRIAFNNLGGQGASATYEWIKKAKLEAQYPRLSSSLKAWLEDLNIRRGLGKRGEMLP